MKDGELILRVGRDWQERLQMGLHTSLSQPRIRCTLVVKNLSGLAVFGYGRATVGALNASALAVELSGAGEVDLQSLSATNLKVSLSGGGRIVIAGESQEQSVSLSGVGQYDAAQLQSRAARVAINGAGSARVWATDDLDVSLSGVGSVEYLGNPVIRGSGWGLGAVCHVSRQADSQRGTR